MLGPDAQPPSRPPWLGGGGPHVGSQPNPRASRSRSLDVFEPRRPERTKDNGVQQGAIAWMGDGVMPAPPTPNRPRSATPSPRRAVALCAEEGPPGNLPLGDRLQQQSLVCTSYPSVPVAGAPRMAACSLGTATQRRVVYGDVETFVEPIYENPNGLQPVVLQLPHSSQSGDDMQRNILVHRSACSRHMCTCSSCPTANSDVCRNPNVGMASTSAEEAALAASALAELRASVALTAGKLDSLETEVAEEARQRQDLSRAFAQHKRKQSEAMAQLGASHGSNDKSNAKIDRLIADWTTKQTHVDSHILSLEQLCRHLQDTCNTMGERVETACEERSQHCSRLQVLQKSVLEESDGRRGLDSRIVGLEQTLNDLQLQVGTTSEKVTTVLAHIPMQAEYVDDMRTQMCRLEDTLKQQCDAASNCKVAIDKLQHEHTEVSERYCCELENRRSELTLLIKDIESQLSAKISQFVSVRCELAGRVEEGDRRLKKLEDSQNILAEKCSRASPELVVSWEVEKHFRNIAEEVSAVTERAMSTYVEAARAELMEHIDSLSRSMTERAMATYVEATRAELMERIDTLSRQWDSKACRDGPPEAFDMAEFSLTETEGGTSAGSMFDDFQGAEHSMAEATYLPREDLSRSHETSPSNDKQRLDVFDRCSKTMPENAYESCRLPSNWRKSRASLCQGPESTPQVQTSRPSQHANTALKRSTSEHRNSLVIAASHGNLPVWRPAGASQALLSPSPMDGHRHYQSSNSARRLRSASPSQLRDGTSLTGPIMRPPSAPRRCDGFAGRSEMPST